MRLREGVVTCPILRLKEYPSAQAETTDEVLYGMTVQLLDRTLTDWAYVETEYGYCGYAKLSGLELRRSAVRRWSRAEKLVICASAADVFEVAGYKNPFVCTLPKGSLVEKDGYMAQAGWTRIRLVKGGSFYIRESMAEPVLHEPASDEQEELLREKLVKTAMSYLNVPYRWGGKTPWGIDCSGLCSMTYLLHGIRIWRDAQLQAGYPVREIPVCQVKPGDLLYFPGHMALYIGELRYVHATGRTGDDRVVIGSLDPKDPAYREDLAETILTAGTVFPRSRNRPDRSKSRDETEDQPVSSEAS